MIDILLPLIVVGTLCVIAAWLGRRSEQRQRAQMAAQEQAWLEERARRLGRTDK